MSYGHPLFLSFVRNTMKEIFTSHYNTNFWSSSESASGPGSEIRNTEKIRSDLSRILNEYKVETMLDAPCGDWNWMQMVDLSSCEYIGADIVSELIEINNDKYAKDNVSFTTLDISMDSLPKVDLVFTRDCLFHFSDEDLRKTINNIKASGSKYLLTTSFMGKSYLDSGRVVNQEIETGGWRCLNLELEPYNFPEPIDRIMEQHPDLDEDNANKSMAMWIIEDLPTL